MTSPFKYDVFLSFRGKDTRYGFISHLHKALRDKQIEAFVDHDLDRGDEISPALSKAIKQSQISVVIFSKKYAKSKWCLEELVQILECKEKHKQIVIPVYYRVDPSQVRNQTGYFGAAFEEHEQCFDNLLVEKWKKALTQAANLSGIHTKSFKLESELVEALVEDILKNLTEVSPSDNNDLVGIDSKIKRLESLLCMELTDVRIIGIWGIGGIGKTTLASIVFNKISNQFEGSYFIQNVKKESEKCGSNSWQQELLSTMLGDGNANVETFVVKHMFTKTRFGRKKLLIVFDDVTDFRQIEFFIRVFYGHRSSSRIIITTKDKQVLKNCRVDQVYEVRPLSHHEALELFCRYAFRQNHPVVDYMELSNKIVRFAGGVPLVLKIFGSLLLEKEIEVWKSAIDKLSRSFHMDIQNVLKISYDELEDEVQNIFLDIACFFKGKDSNLARKVLNASGFFAEIGMGTLIDKSMITVSDYNQIIMHDLLQAMGKEIVRQESVEDPGNRTRLWNHEDIFHVLTKNSGTKIIEGISLDTSKIRDISFHTNAFLKMHKLRLLEFYSSTYAEDINKVNVSHGLEPIFTGLKYLHWYGFPLTSLPQNFCLDNLVILEMPYSKVKHLWNSFQLLERLKEINLSYSKYLIDLPNLEGLPNLESLILVGCTSLFEIPSSIQYLHKLNILDLSDCKSLKSLPSCVDLKSLTKLYLSGCSDLSMLPDISCTIEELYLDETAIEELPSSIECLCKLVLLDLTSCSRLKNLPNNICELKSLKRLTVSDCSLLDQLPEDLGTLEFLMELEVEGTAVREVPASIFHLNNLDVISFRRYCKSPDMGGLRLPSSFSLHHLKELDLSNCGIVEVPDCFGKLTSLERLYLCGNNFLSIPSSIMDLAKLSEIDISNCEKLRCLPNLSLISIDAHNCVSLEELSGLQVLDTIKSTDQPFIIVNFINCLNLKWIVLESIVDILRKMQNLATLWKEEYYDKGFDKLPRAFICYPESEIPNWFRYHSAEPFVNIKLPQDWFNSNFVGFALCIVVAFRAHQDHDCGFAIRCVCKHQSVDHSTFDDWAIFCGGPCSIESDHVFMGFDFHMYPSDYIAKSFNNEVSFKFYVEHLCSGKSKQCCWVKKCGVSLMYAQDRGKANGRFLTREEIEEQPPKRLKLSDSERNTQMDRRRTNAGAFMLEVLREK